MKTDVIVNTTLTKIILTPCKTQQCQQQARSEHWTVVSLRPLTAQTGGELNNYKQIT